MRIAEERPACRNSKLQWAWLSSSVKLDAGVATSSSCAVQSVAGGVWPIVRSQRAVASAPAVIRDWPPLDNRTRSSSAYRVFARVRAGIDDLQKRLSCLRHDVVVVRQVFEGGETERARRVRAAGFAPAPVEPECIARGF